MTNVVVGVMGHVDHGKTALVEALTGTMTDRLPEEKARGISIALGFASIAAAGRTVDLIDMPGHERFVRTLVAGATGIDAVLLVVAANEGIRPQTLEHIEIASLLGLRQACVAIAKCDLVPPDEAERVAGETAALLEARGFATGAAIHTAARAGAGTGALRERLLALVPRRRVGDAAPTMLPVDRAFSVPGHGTVVTGTLRGAAVRPGDVLDLLPSGRTVRVRGAQVRGTAVSQAAAGQRVALNLRDIAAGEVRRGVVLASPQALRPSAWRTIAIRSPAGAPPLRNGQSLLALLGTDQVEVRLRLLDGDVLEPGEQGFAQLHAREPVALPAGEHVILRIASPAETVAGGPILEPVAQRRPRYRPRVLERLARLRDLPAGPLIDSELDEEGTAGTTIDHLARLCALRPAVIAEMLDTRPVVVTRDGRVFRRDDVERTAHHLTMLLGASAAGMSRKQLGSAVPGARAALVDEALRGLQAAGSITRRGGQFAAPRPEEDRAREASEAETKAQVAEIFRLGGLTPPQPAAITADPAAGRAVTRLLREGVLVRAVDRAKGRELLFHRDAIAGAMRVLAPLLGGGGGLLVTEIGAALGTSRKFTMPLLAHLDYVRFTERFGDRRRAGSSVSGGAAGTLLPDRRMRG